MKSHWGYTLAEVPQKRCNNYFTETFILQNSWSCPQAYLGAGCRRKSPLDGPTDFLTTIWQHIKTVSFFVNFNFGLPRLVSCVIQHTLTRLSTRMALEVWWFKFYDMVLHCKSPVVQKSILIFNTRFSSEWWFVKIFLRHRHGLTVDDGALGHKIDYVTILKEILNLEGHSKKLRQFCWMGGFCLLGELHRWRVCVCSLRSGLVLY